MCPVRVARLSSTSHRFTCSCSVTALCGRRWVEYLTPLEGSAANLGASDDRRPPHGRAVDAQAAPLLHRPPPRPIPPPPGRQVTVVAPAPPISQLGTGVLALVPAYSTTTSAMSSSTLLRTQS